MGRRTTFRNTGEVTSTDTEKDAVESYIENAEPPIGVSLNQQYCQRLNDVARNNTIQQCERYVLMI